MEATEIIEDYLKAEVAKGQMPTVFGFVQLHTNVVQSTPVEDPGQFWPTAVSRASKRLNITLGKSKRKVQWKTFHKAAAEAQEQTARTKHSRSSNTKDQFIQAYECMSDNEKWKLDDGVYVEDLIYQHGLRSNNEHPAHSFILDVDDACWDDIISPAQMSEIKAAGLRGFPGYNDDVKDIIDALSSTVKETRVLQLSSTTSLATNTAISEKEIIDGLWKKMTSYGFFDPYNQVDQHWLQRTVIEILDVYRWWIVDHGSELDFVARLRSMLDKAFDSLQIKTGRAQTALNTNQERPVTEDSMLQSIRPDLVLFRNGSEYEHEADISKEKIAESQLQLLITLKIMFNYAVLRGDNKVSLIRTLRVVGVQQHHLCMRAYVLDSPGGYVCRLRSTPQYEISSQASLMPFGLFQILKLIMKVKEAVRLSIQTVEKHMTEDGDEEPDVACNINKSLKLNLPDVANYNRKKLKTST